MAATTINISFPEDLLADIDAEAKQEARSRSELLQEAARLYVTRQRGWDAVFMLGDEISRKQNLRPNDVPSELKAVRDQRRSK